MTIHKLRRHRAPARWWLPVAAAAALAACGGGSTPTASSTPTADSVATFIDSPVAGLAFKSERRSGLTDRNGNFPYQPGETLTFSVGNLVLGSVTPTGDKVTPLQLAPGAADASDPRVTRMLRALQSMDGDGDLNNGIQIGEQAHALASEGSTLRLDDSRTTDAEVQDRLPTGRYTRSIEEARKHFEDHADDEANDDQGYDGGSTGGTGNTGGTGGTGSTPPVAQPANTAGRLLASNCFQCHGTMGRGGFESIRGGEAGEVREYLGKSASGDIMAAHAQGYTRAQLDAIVTYLNQP